MKKRMEDKGVEIHTGVSVTEILGKNGKVCGAKLSDGRELSSDLVYIAIGVLPNTKLAEDAGIKCDRGILVERTMETNVKDIYACGDSTKGHNFLDCDKNMVIAIWPVARKMGYYAGFNMAGRKAIYDGSVPMNSLYFDDLFTVSYGDSNPVNPDEYEIMFKLFEDGITYRKFVIKNNRLVGAAFVNDISRAGVVKGLLYEDIPVSKYKDFLLRNDFSFIHLPKAYRDEVYQKPFEQLNGLEEACDISAK